MFYYCKSNRWGRSIAWYAIAQNIAQKHGGLQLIHGELISR